VNVQLHVHALEQHDGGRFAGHELLDVVGLDAGKCLVPVSAQSQARPLPWYS
jgi:hypothetical protein